MIEDTQVDDLIGRLKESVYGELSDNILPFWINHSRDIHNAGFFGVLDNQNNGNTSEPRSVVMTARHLWTYSAAYRVFRDAYLLEAARYAYSVLSSSFIDSEHGGVYWTVDPEGKPVVSKKQIYGQAFAIYGLAEYAIALYELNDDIYSHDISKALDEALSIYHLIEAHARDMEFGAYIEACAEDWSKTENLKLSDKDIDCDKSMNTNLHVLEALSTLFHVVKKIYPDEKILVSQIRESLTSLLDISFTHILGSDSHLDMFFDQNWEKIGDCVSYGHDIEASWLLWEAVEELQIEEKADLYRTKILSIADCTMKEGLEYVSNTTAALCNEKYNNHLDKTRVWWCQAEALVGFYNAWELSGKNEYLQAVFAIWNWIDGYQIDKKYGDWFSEVSPEGIPDLDKPKGGNWKTPYHNGRSCMELLKRIEKKGIK